VVTRFYFIVDIIYNKKSGRNDMCPGFWVHIKKLSKLFDAILTFGFSKDKIGLDSKLLFNVNC